MVCDNGDLLVCLAQLRGEQDLGLEDVDPGQYGVELGIPIADYDPTNARVWPSGPP